MYVLCQCLCRESQVLIIINSYDELEMEYSSFELNTIPADALAPKVARASAGIVLAV